MIYLITGMPGNGKTLYAVEFIRDAVKKGRAVYSDIKGLTLEGVQPAPDDWRTLPDGSLVVYDEAHKRFPSYRGKGRSPLQVVQDMDEHRHRGFDLMFITQWPDKIDGELFRLVGEHCHLNRAFGLQSANLCKFTRGVLNPYSNLARKGADETIWSYPKDLYGVYKSSSLHTDSHKFKMPLKIRNALITAPMIAAVLWGLYAFLVPSQPKAAEEERSEAETTTQPLSAIAGGGGIQPIQAQDKAPPSGEYFSLTAPAVPQLAGCVSSDRGCRCFNSDGFQIDQTQAECAAIIARPLPINVYHQYVQGQRQDAPPDVESKPDSDVGNSGVVVGYRAGNRADIFPQNPARQAESYTPATTSM